MNTETIAAIATASGVGSIAIVRLSGLRAYDIALKMTQRPALQPRHTTLSSLYNIHGEMIDQALVIFFQGPKSFTGEDCVEFQCHGGFAVASLVLDALLACDVRLAQPGEFTKRAFLNGRIDMSQAEAAQALIMAKSSEAVTLLARQLKGELGRFVDDIRRQLLEVLAYSEVLIDYADEDLPENIMQSIAQKLTVLSELLGETVSSSLRRQGAIAGYHVAIIGKPNVGKSSLLNALLSWDRAIVSSVAGTTRDTVEESLQVGSHVIRIIDTAGIRQATDEIEQIGIQRSIQAIDEAQIVIALFDGSRSWDEEDEEILNLIKTYEKDKEILVIINKSDLPHYHPMDSLVGYYPLFLSCKSSVSPLLQALQERLDRYNGEETMLLVSKRQIEATKMCQQAIYDAMFPLENGELEIFSFHIREAIDAIGSISHPYNVEEMLGVMFGNFCLGK